MTNTTKHGHEGCRKRYGVLESVKVINLQNCWREDGVVCNVRDLGWCGQMAGLGIFRPRTRSFRILTGSVWKLRRMSLSSCIFLRANLVSRFGIHTITR
jgi:hypothetical protein